MLFIPFGITPTANRPYQLVRRGSMGTAFFAQGGPELGQHLGRPPDLPAAAAT